MAGVAAVVDLDRSHAVEDELRLLLTAPDGEARAPTIVREGSWSAFAVASRGLPDESLSIAASIGHGPRLVASLDGWIDNRVELWTRLGEEPSSAIERSDAELLLAAFARWHGEAFELARGSFACLVFECDRGVLHLFREPLGERTLHYRRRGARIGVATRPSTLWAYGSASPRLDETSIVRFLALRGPAPGATFFHEIREVPPGLALGLDRSGERPVRSSRLAPARFPERTSERDFEQRFREVLDQAVSRRLPRRGGVAISMSGGLDSTSIAATASRELAARSAPAPVSISWVFRELEEADESKWIAAANRALRVRPALIPSDDLWPLADEPTWPRPLDSPFQDLYWRPRERLFRIARQEGCSVVLNGESGDELWLHAFDWLADLVRAGDLRIAAAEIARAVGYRLRGMRIRHPLLGSIRRAIAPSPPTAYERPAPWLAPWALQRLEESERGQGSSAATPRYGPLERPLLSPLRMAASAMTARLSEPFGLDVRRPFRDRDLVELMLGIPPRLLYRPGETKRLLRRALIDRLPDEVLGRKTATSFLGLADRGLALNSWATLRRVLEEPTATWPRFIRGEWLWKNAVPALGSPNDGVERLVLWQVFSLERWLESLPRALADSLRVQ